MSVVSLKGWGVPQGERIVCLRITTHFPRFFLGKGHFKLDGTLDPSPKFNFDKLAMPGLCHTANSHYLQVQNLCYGTLQETNQPNMVFRQLPKGSWGFCPLIRFTPIIPVPGAWSQRDAAKVFLHVLPPYNAAMVQSPEGAKKGLIANHIWCSNCPSGVQSIWAILSHTRTRYRFLLSSVSSLYLMNPDDLLIFLKNSTHIHIHRKILCF